MILMNANLGMALGALDGSTLEGAIQWLEGLSPAVAYASLIGIAALEYIFPPAPGNTLALGGATLAIAGAFAPSLVFFCLVGGSFVGAMLAYAAGRWLEGRPPMHWMEKPIVASGLERTRAFYESHGALFIAANRFIPGLRSFCFFGAGLFRMPAMQVALLGTLSAALYNGLLLLLAWQLSTHLDQIANLIAPFAVVCVAAAILFLWRRKRKATVASG